VKFYKRFPGDIQIKTGGLTMAEFGAYDRLLDHYYATELPIEPDEVYSIARALSRSDREAVDKVLAKFFKKDAGGRWIQERADEMIAEALPKIEAARENGKKGGRPSKAKIAALGKIKEPTGLFDGTDDDPNAKTSQSQNQNGSVAKATAADAAAGDVDNSGKKAKSAEDIAKAQVWRAAVSVLAQGGCPNEDQARSFMGKLVGDYTFPVVKDAVAAAVSEQPADAREYLKATCQRKKGERRDPVTVASNEAEKTRAYLDAQSAHGKDMTPEERAARIAEARAVIAARKAEGVAA